MKKMYIFVGKNKDADGECRALLEKTVNECGACVTENASEADVIAVLGGDGTIMRAASVAVEYDIPVIGINLGHVGYMAELDKGEIPLIANFFNGYVFLIAVAVKFINRINSYRCFFKTVQIIYSYRFSLRSLRSCKITITA